MRARPGLSYGSVPVGIALLLSLAWLLTQRSYDSVEADVRSITTNSAPSLLHLAELGVGLDVVERETLLAIEHGAWPVDTGGRSRVSSALATMNYHLEEYGLLPSYKVEAAGKARLRTLVDELAALVGRDGGDVGRRVLPVTRAMRRILRDLTRLNAARAAAEARIVEDALVSARRRSFAVVVGMVVVATCSWVLLRRQSVRFEREREQRLAELDAFSARVAHDLRGPIASVGLAVELLKREGAGLSPSTGDVLQRIARGVEQQTQLIDALLAFARAGARASADATTRADEVVERVLQGLSALAQEHRTRLRWSVEPDVVVRASAGVLSSIVDNLARNAVVHMGASDERTVDVRVTATQDRAVLEVTDTGPGIPPDQVERLFMPFQRGSTSGPGHGLGLATVKRLVEGHRGVITVTSHPGRGSTFRVELPRALAESSGATKRRSGRATAPGVRP